MTEDAGWPHTIDLTPSESALLEELQLDASALPDDHTIVLRNGELACDLTKSLIARDALPKHRTRYFTDPEFNPGGRGRARIDGFIRNGRHGNEILKHPHFLKYLSYFLYGAVLPKAVIDGFYKRVQECGLVTSSDVVPLGTFARTQARANRLNGKVAAEEFYKLALDCGLSGGYAASIRDSVMRVR